MQVPAHVFQTHIDSDDETAKMYGFQDACITY